jgi:hypothetical protein
MSNKWLGLTFIRTSLIPFLTEDDIEDEIPEDSKAFIPVRYGTLPSSSDAITCHLEGFPAEVLVSESITEDLLAILDFGVHLGVVHDSGR